MRENYGDLNELKKLGKNKTKSFTTEQLLNKNLKNLNGESRDEVTQRIKKGFEKVLSENIGKRIVIVSHGASIKFLLLQWCKLDENNEIVFNGKEIKLNSPGVLKLTFDNTELIDLVQIV